MSERFRAPGKIPVTSNVTESEKPEPAASKTGRNLPVAIGVAIVLIAVVAASLFIRKEAFVALVFIACAVGLHELKRAFEKAELQIAYIPLVVGSAGILISAYTAGVEAAFIAFLLTAGVTALWHLFDDGGLEAVHLISASLFSAVYVPFMASFVIHMAAAPQDGHWRVVAFILVVIASDTGAYFTGILIGKHRMSPVVSPNKSWEGFVGGLVTASIVGALLAIFLLDTQWWIGALIGSVGALAGVLGDLAESLIKRDLNIKDMGTILPGHGGVLDRIDSLLVAAPAVFTVMVLLIPK